MKAERKSGTLQGVVIYKADPQRPWRYARYYIKDRKKGRLAETVVALAGRGLKSRVPSRRPATMIVDQKNFQFVPETVVLRTGDRMKFLNSDKQVHNVHAFHLIRSFNVNMPAGGTHTETFKAPTGMRLPYRLGCVYHSAMRAWIFVLDHPYYQLTGPDGSFRITGVPPGTYKLNIVHPSGELRDSQTVTVKAGSLTRLTVVLSPDNKPKKRR